MKTSSSECVHFCAPPPPSPPTPPKVAIKQMMTKVTERIIARVSVGVDSLADQTIYCCIQLLMLVLYFGDESRLRDCARRPNTNDGNTNVGCAPGLCRTERRKSILFSEHLRDVVSNNNTHAELRSPRLPMSLLFQTHTHIHTQYIMQTAC